MGWEGGADIYDPIGLNISCFCAHLHLLVSISARLSLLGEASAATLAPFRLASFPSPFSPIIFLHMLSLPAFLSFSLSYLDRLEEREREREALLDEDQRRGNFSIVVSRIFSFSSRLRDKGWYSALENARGWKKLITVREHELEGERERERGNVRKEAGSLANNFANGRRVIRRA